MKTHPKIVVMAVLAVMLAFSAPTFATWTVQLAQNPVLISGGVYDGKIEYFFDFYMTSDCMYFMQLVGLDNSKIANAQTHEPASFGGDFVRVQQWGEGPDSWFAAQPGWSIATGRIFDLWSKDINETLAKANIDNLFRSSYDDGAGGWADAGLGFPEPALNNPHSYSEYADFHGGGADVWKAELMGPGQPVQWQVSDNWFGAETSEDAILLMGTNGQWAPTGGGLIMTLRVVYDEEIDPLTIGWGTNKENPVLGDFTVIPEPATMSLLALGGLAVLRRRRKA